MVLIEKLLVGSNFSPVISQRIILKMKKVHLICVHVCSQDRVRVRGQLAGTGSLLPPFKSWGPSSCCHTWQQVPLPAEPSCQPPKSILLVAF